VGIFFRDPQLDRIEAVVDGIETSTRNLLAAAARIEKNQEINMSRTSEALDRLATATATAAHLLADARADAQAAKANADAVVAGDAAEDAAQLDAVDTAHGAAIDEAVRILAEALADPAVPADPPAAQPAPEQPAEPAPVEPAPVEPGDAPLEPVADVTDPAVVDDSSANG
jgi:hypothetical protein